MEVRELDMQVCEGVSFASFVFWGASALLIRFPAPSPNPTAVPFPKGYNGVITG